MRQSDLNRLGEPYSLGKMDNLDRRFNSAIEADVPSANKLAKEIFADLDPNVPGIRWWRAMPAEERILIGDYLYQCVTAIEVNLVEARLHYLEWLDAAEKRNEKIAGAIFRDESGRIQVKMPPPVSALDDLPARLQGMHICGFFRAVGSALDCLGAAMIGVLGLRAPLRKADLASARKALPKENPEKDPGIELQTEFGSLFDSVKASCGAADWQLWADQTRNMYVHRARRTSFHQIHPRETPLYDARNRWIPRADETQHLVKHPDRSDIEAFIVSKDINLNEDAQTTLSGIFRSSRELTEATCERLVAVWIERRRNPALIEQPAVQWDAKIKECNFQGYDSRAETLDADLGLINPVMEHRMRAASVFDRLRRFWDNSEWKK